jgi:formylglycine-generating enzyme required for sulfatase activity
MRRIFGPASFTCFLAMGFAASAEDVYLTATGDMVGALDAFQDCDVCPEMIVLPLGQFQMGSSVEEAIAANRRYFTNSNIDPSAFDEQLRRAFIDLGIDPDDPEDALLEYYASGNINPKEDPQYSVAPMLHEVPAHQVLIDLPIAMGRNEVTREEWAACVADGGCEKGLEDMPPSTWLACENTDDCTMTPDDRIRHRMIVFGSAFRTGRIQRTRAVR